MQRRYLFKDRGIISCFFFGSLLSKTQWTIVVRWNSSRLTPLHRPTHPRMWLVDIKVPNDSVNKSSWDRSHQPFDYHIQKSLPLSYPISPQQEVLVCNKFTVKRYLEVLYSSNNCPNFIYYVKIVHDSW